jgi:hypothetical protein
MKKFLFSSSRLWGDGPIGHPLPFGERDRVREEVYFLIKHYILLGSSLGIEL